MVMEEFNVCIINEQMNYNLSRVITVTNKL